MTRPRTLRDTIEMGPETAPGADTFGPERHGGQAAAAEVRRGLFVRVSAETRRDLKLAALARGTTVQALVLGAIALILNPPVEEPPPPRRPGA